MKDFFDTWKFKILVAVAVFLVGIMAYAGANGRLTAAPQELLSVVLTPFQKVTSALSGGIGSVWEKYTSIDDVMAQNEQLEAENAELRQQMVDYDRIKAENEAYKALTRIQDANSEASYVSGFVIGRDPLDEFGGFTLDCGTVNGVAVSDAVISDKGYLVGVVVEADTTSCKVMTVLHPSFNAAGVVSRTRETASSPAAPTTPVTACACSPIWSAPPKLRWAIRSSPPALAACSRRMCWWAWCRRWSRKSAANPRWRSSARAQTRAPSSMFLSSPIIKEAPVWNHAVCAAAVRR